MRRFAILLASVGILISGCEVPTAPTASCFRAANMASPTLGMEVGIGFSDLGGTSVAQPFIPNSSGNISSVTIPLQRVGYFPSASQVITVSVESNSLAGLQMGNPNGVPLVTSSGLDVATISNYAPTGYTFSFSAVSLTVNQIYWLRVRGSYPVSKSDYVTWAATDGISNAYVVDGVNLNAIYETGASTNGFSTAQIGTHRFMLFNFGC